jgi:hypothetical protein
VESRKTEWDRVGPWPPSGSLGPPRPGAQRGGIRRGRGTGGDSVEAGDGLGAARHRTAPPTESLAEPRIEPESGQAAARFVDPLTRHEDCHEPQDLGLGTMFPGIEPCSLARTRAVPVDLLGGASFRMMGGSLPSCPKPPRDLRSSGASRPAVDDETERGATGPSAWASRRAVGLALSATERPPLTPLYCCQG